MNFDPVNDATHALALKQIVGEAMSNEMDRHEEHTHMPETARVAEVEKELKALNKEKWLQRGYGTAIATVLAYIGYKGL